MRASMYYFVDVRFVTMYLMPFFSTLSLKQTALKNIRIVKAISFKNIFPITELLENLRVLLRFAYQAVEKPQLLKRLYRV